MILITLLLFAGAPVTHTASAAVPSGIACAWTGVFRGQPEDVKPDGTRFELTITTQGGHIKGTLTVLSKPQIARAIRETECDLMGCSFEVVDNIDGDVFTWRIRPHGDKLRGTRNSGETVPEIGWGTGARLFNVEAIRADTAPKRHRTAPTTAATPGSSTSCRTATARDEPSPKAKRSCGNVESGIRRVRRQFAVDDAVESNLPRRRLNSVNRVLFRVTV
jgi:hypothetical protein